MGERLPKSYQENLLTGLCYSEEVCLQVQGILDIEFFDTDPFRVIAEQALLFFERFDSPIRDNLPDFFEEILARNDEESELYRGIIDRLYLSQDSVNAGFVISFINDFIREKRILAALYDGIQLVRRGSFEEAQSLVLSGFESKYELDHGTLFWDVDRVIQSVQSLEEDFISTGIPELDIIRFGLYPGELVLFAAPPNRGKSWFCVFCGVNALVQRKRVVHISLEMPERQITRRYLQAFFGISKSESEIVRVKFDIDQESKSLLGFKLDRYQPKHNYEDPGILHYIERRMQQFHQSRNLIIKQFPTGGITVKGISNYLDYLVKKFNFVPDVVIVDYPDLLQLGTSRESHRLNINDTYVALRGLAVEHNLNVLAPSQTNRSSLLAEDMIDERYIAEDYGKIGIVDRTIFYNQTRQERELGLARLLVDKNREGPKDVLVLISQCYEFGQFCYDSYLLKKTNEYQRILEEEA